MWWEKSEEEAEAFAGNTLGWWDFSCRRNGFEINIQAWCSRINGKSSVKFLLRKGHENEWKKRKQDRLRKEMGLLVDIPKPEFGMTNDGISARRFFEDPGLASETTGVDEGLIRWFGTIFKTSGRHFVTRELAP